MRTGSSQVTLFFCIASAILHNFPSEARQDACEGYRCLRRLQRKDSDELDEESNNKQDICELAKYMQHNRLFLISKVICYIGMSK